MNKRQKKKYYKSGRLLLEGRVYSRKLRGIRVLCGRAIDFDAYVKYSKFIIKCATETACH